MNRELWTQSLSKTYCPVWPCPVCHKGTISLVQKSLMHKETASSIDARDHKAWEPDWIEYTFTAWAQCRHPLCNQYFAIAGIGGVGTESGTNGDYELTIFFAPMVCQPMPDMINLPTKCPEKVKNELRTSFALFWAHQTACAGRIRVALECLMNHLRIPKRKKRDNGKYSNLTLHKRIDTFASCQPEIGSHLMALKWLGNTGSHIGDVSQTDLLDAFEIMEHILGEIIDKRSVKVAALAKKLTQKHGR